MPTLIDQAIILCSLKHKLIITASSGIKKKVNINKNNSSMKQMPTNAWFDSECNELRKTIYTYAKRSNLTHTENNNFYHNLCNNYKRMIQRKRRNCNTNLKVNLEEMCSNNPKDYWGFWKRLQRQNLSESTNYWTILISQLFSKTKWATYRSKRKYKIQNYTTKNTYW